MDISSLASMVSATQQGSIDQQMSVALLKQAMQAQAIASLQLINTVTPANNLPPNLGQNINVSV